MIKIFGLRILTKSDMEKIDNNFELGNEWVSNVEQRLESLLTLIDLQQEQLDILAEEVFKKEITKEKKKGTKKKE